MHFDAINCSVDGVVSSSVPSDKLLVLVRARVYQPLLLLLLFRFGLQQCISKISFDILTFERACDASAYGRRMTFQIQSKTIVLFFYFHAVDLTLLFA